MRSHLLRNVSWVLIVFFQMGCMFNASISNLQSLTSESSVPSASPSPTSPEPAPSVTTTLKLTGNSSSLADASLRVFDETKPTWTLTGNCESDNGMVQISGDIDTPFSVSCLNDSFSISINYSVTSPYFISGASASRKIKISQGASSEEVILYKTASGNPARFIRTLADFGDMYTYKNGVFIIANDIDASNGGVNLVNNFSPVDYMGMDFFTGTLEGDGHTLSNFNSTSDYWYSCLIVWVAKGAVFKNIKMTNVKLATNVYGAASTRIGPLFCNTYPYAGTGEVLIENVSIQGQIISNDADTVVGGLAADLSAPATVKNVDVDMTFSGQAMIVGGLLGGSSSATISKAHAKATMNMTTGTGFPAGGLVGILGSSSMGTTSQIRDSYFTGSIGSGQIIGGLVGKFDGNGQVIQNSYSDATITVPSGKLGGPIIGSVAGFTYTMSSTFYPSSTICTLCTNTLGSPKPAAEMKLPDMYLGWDFVNIWKVVSGVSYPTLR